MLALYVFLPGCTENICKPRSRRPASDQLAGQRYVIEQICQVPRRIRKMRKPANDAVITPFGAESTTSNYNVAYHPDAFAVAFVDLMLPHGLDKATRATHKSGIRMTYLSDFFIKEYEGIDRLDILNGELCVRPEMACIVAGGDDGV